jgi:putative acetyltransferase
MTQFQFITANQTFWMEPTIESEIPHLSNIIESVFIEYNWSYVESDEVPDFINFNQAYADPERAMIFSVKSVTNNQEIIGCIALKFNNEGPYLSRVYLKQDFRGFGLGKWMSVEMMNLARERGFKHIHLWTDTRFIAAHHMYLRVGFSMSGLLRSLHDINNSFEFKMEAPL